MNHFFVVLLKVVHFLIQSLDKLYMLSKQEIKGIPVFFFEIKTKRKEKEKEK